VSDVSIDSQISSNITIGECDNQGNCNEKVVTNFTQLLEEKKHELQDHTEKTKLDSNLEKPISIQEDSGLFFNFFVWLLWLIISIWITFILFVIGGGLFSRQDVYL